MGATAARTGRSTCGLVGDDGLVVALDQGAQLGVLDDADVVEAVLIVLADDVRDVEVS